MINRKPPQYQYSRSKHSREIECQPFDTHQGRYKLYFCLLGSIIVNKIFNENKRTSKIMKKLVYYYKFKISFIYIYFFSYSVLKYYISLPSPTRLFRATLVAVFLEVSKRFGSINPQQKNTDVIFSSK